MGGLTLLERIDSQLDEFFKGWNWLSTILAVILVLYLVYPLIVSEEPDTHPLLLARQANSSQIRQPGESAIYRSLDTPHSFPLKTGLNVKEAGAPRWATGEDGDLRDIWRRAVQGSVSERGMRMGEIGKIQTVVGQQVIDHDLQSISREINILGKYIKQQDIASVAVYLPNSIEILTVIFAAAFYGFTPVLIPYGLPEDVVIQLIQLANAEFVVGTAGSIPSDEMRKHCKMIKGALWIVDRANREVDFTEPGKNVHAWHEILEKYGSETTSDLPENVAEQSPPGITSIWLAENPKHGELVTFAQSNIVAAVGAQLSALPHAHRISPKDLFLPADSLTSPYILIQTFAALYSNASIALHSVSGHDVELPLAASGISPTIIAASAESAAKLHDVLRSKINTSIQKFALKNQLQALEAGHMPRKSFMSSIIPLTTVTLGTPPSKLRLLYLYERSNADSPPLSSSELAELRVLTGARIIYALTTPKVAGTVTQTGFFDYRAGQSDGQKKAHFGVPVGSVEIKAVDSEEFKTVEGKRPQGEIVAKGPSVLGGSANLGVIGWFAEDGTLSLSL